VKGRIFKSFSTFLKVCLKTYLPFPQNKNSEAREKTPSFQSRPLRVFRWEFHCSPTHPPPKKKQQQQRGTANSFGKFPEKPGRKYSDVFLFFLFQIIPIEMTEKFL